MIGVVIIVIMIIDISCFGCVIIVVLAIDSIGIMLSVVVSVIILAIMIIMTSIITSMSRNCNESKSKPFTSIDRKGKSGAGGRGNSSSDGVY